MSAVTRKAIERREQRQRKEAVLGFGDTTADDRVIIARIDAELVTPLFTPGQEVWVKRSSGARERWTVSGTDANGIVTTQGPRDTQGIPEKQYSEVDLAALNPDVEG